MVHINIAYLNICTKDAIGYTFNINGILFKSNEKLMVDITRETSDIINIYCQLFIVYGLQLNFNC